MEFSHLHTQSIIPQSLNVQVFTFLWSRWNNFFSVGTGYGQPDINCDKCLKIVLFSIPDFFFLPFYEMSKVQGFLSRDRKRMNGSVQ